MDFKSAFSILLGFLGGFVFAVLLIITVVKRLFKVGMRMKTVDEDEDE